MKKAHLIILTALFVLISTELSAQKATIKEEQQVIKTYSFSGPDPAPIMIRSSMWGKGPKLYPYYFFNELSATGKDQTWNVVHIENPYIKVSILPEEGGKLIGAVEKSTNNEFIYNNHVRKYRQLALRGPWTSGGIELNFGLVGHTAAGATPVDYLIRENPDGSVSCIVGAMDLPSRTHWSVNFTLPPDKAYFESHALWYNPTPLNQSYYVWMNASARAGDDLEFVLPGTSHIGHSYSVQEQPWPMTEDGRDLSWYRNNNFGGSKSYFTHGEFENFAGGYWHDSEFGFGHWALYEDIPGRKYWIWALSRSGGIWEDLLTDSDGQYVEPQVGRLFNQSDHEFFAPYTTDHWREVWFPYKKIGPMVKATPFGALNVTHIDDSISFGFCALQKLDDDLVVIADGKEVYREHLALQPMEVYKKIIPVKVEKGKLQVKVGDKLSYSDDPGANDLHRPINFRNFDESSLEGLYLAAERNEKERNYDLALEKYLSCLEQEPLHTRALTRVAELYCRRAEYKKALTYAHKALDNVMYDPDANYIYGVISRNLGNLVDAKETLGWAARSMKYRSGAYCQMAEIYLLEENLELALEYTQRSLDYNTYNIKAYQVQATTYRLFKQPELASQTLNRILELDPLNHQARFELYLLELNRKNLADFTSMIRNELPHETYLEIAIYYVNLGLYNDAIQLLEVAPEYPTILFWHAYLLKDKDPSKSREYLHKAASLSPRLVFPFREESIPVFEWAAETLKTNWKAKYYLGLIYWGKIRHDDARALFALCDTADYAPFYIARGYLNRESDYRKTIADYEKARALDREDWRNWHHTVSIYNEHEMFDKALTLSREAAQLFPGEDIITIDLARTLMNNKLYQECFSLMENLEVLPYEGQRDIHRLFVQCQIYLALETMRKGDYARASRHFENSKQYPERLGTGQPYNPDFRLQDYLMVLCYDEMADKDKAEETRKRIYDYTLNNWNVRSANRYFGALILQHFGEKEKAKQLLENWQPSRQGEIIREALGLIETMDNKK